MAEFNMGYEKSIILKNEVFKRTTGSNTTKIARSRDNERIGRSQARSSEMRRFACKRIKRIKIALERKKRKIRVLSMAQA